MVPVPNERWRFGRRSRSSRSGCSFARVHVGGRHHGHDLVALLQADAAELDVLAHVARLGELHRRDEPQEFLDRQVDPAPVLLEPVAQLRDS